MEPPRGFLATLWNFICFLPYFIGLLILGFIKGIIICPIVCIIMTVGNSAIILGLWPAHFVWAIFSIASAKQLGPVLKLVLCICVTPALTLWPALGVPASILGGLAYGFLAPLFGTFKAVGEGNTNELLHCIIDGTWDTLKGSFTFIRDLRDVCFHSYFSFLEEFRHQLPPPGGKFEIRVLYLLGAIIAGSLGLVVNFPVISVVAILKSPYMLIKGWHRLFHDCIGREGPFLETICVPFAGLAILLWPLAVAGALLGSMVSSIFLGLYAAVVVYQESSLWFGLCYIIAVLSIYDEYSNDILDMPEGSCFPRPKYRHNAGTSQPSSRAPSFSGPDSSRKAPSRSSSLKNTPMVELRPLELLDNIFRECRIYGEKMVSEGLITLRDLEDAKSSKDSGRIIGIGLPAYCVFQSILRSIKAPNCTGILLYEAADGVNEITSTNRPKDAFFDWFLNPILIIKEQIKAANLSEAEEEYLGKLVLLSGDPQKLKNSNIGLPPENELRRAELDALARRLQGIIRSVSRYPTYKRRCENSVKAICEDLARKNGSGKGSSGPTSTPRSKSSFARMFSQKSLKGKTGSNHGADQESQPCVDIDVDIV